MIISPPFLPTPDADEDRFIAAAMPDSPIIAPDSGGAPLGSFALTTSLTWHNGLHLQAPLDGQGQPLPVCAMADGIVIYRQDPTPPNASPTDGQNYNPFGSGPAWTDNGIVIIKHDTEIGAAGTQGTTLTYYSLYMHLSRVEAGVVKDQRIWRKDSIGTAGRLFGHERHLHVEICFDESQLANLLGTARGTRWQDPDQVPTTDGRRDAVFGSIVIYLRADTPTLASSSTPSSHIHGGQPGTAPLGAAQWVCIDYRQGSAYIRSLRANTDAVTGARVGDPIGTKRSDPDFEYDLYTHATSRHNSLSVQSQSSSSPSGWYELLRFGRNLGTDALPATAAHWRKIPTANGEVWADLNAPGSFKFSEADFVPVLGWNCYGDDANPGDQRCDSARLKGALRERVGAAIRGATASHPESLGRHLGDEPVRALLRGAICSFPTEWDKPTIVARYSWLKTDKLYAVPEGPPWEDFKRHCETITRDDLPEGYKKSQWHLHPREFVRLMRKCGWLSEREAIQMFPKAALRKAKTGWVNEPVNPARQTLKDNLIYLNMSTRKYCVTTARRLAAFYGNAMQETQWFGLLAEGGAAQTRYAPWYGRGFLQLTWPDNYIKYAKFRGMHVSPTVESQLLKAQQTADKTRSNAALAALEGRVPADLRDLRDSISSARPREEASDSAGAYWAWSKASKSADQTAPFLPVDIAIANATVRYYTHTGFGNVAATVNVGHPSTSYSSIYGVQARFQAHTYAVKVLLDQEQFQNARGHMTDKPEGWARRLP